MFEYHQKTAQLFALQAFGYSPITAMRLYGTFEEHEMGTYTRACEIQEVDRGKVWKNRKEDIRSY